MKTSLLIAGFASCFAATTSLAVAEDADLLNRSINIVNQTDQIIVEVRSARKGETNYGKVNLLGEEWRIGPGANLYVTPEDPQGFCQFYLGAILQDGTWVKTQGTINICENHEWQVQSDTNESTTAFDFFNSAGQPIYGLYLGRVPRGMGPMDGELGFNYLASAPVLSDEGSTIAGPFSKCVYDIVLATEYEYVNVKDADLCGEDGGGFVVYDGLIPFSE